MEYLPFLLPPLVSFVFGVVFGAIIGRSRPAAEVARLRNALVQERSTDQSRALSEAMDDLWEAQAELQTRRQERDGLREHLRNCAYNGTKLCGVCGLAINACEPDCPGPAARSALPPSSQAPHEMMCPVCGLAGTCATCRAEQDRAHRDPST